MISIIICSRNKQLLQLISENISITVGVPYELIVIDNGLNKHSISSAYNEGVRLSKYDVLCFTHEDILFFTQNWGEKVISHFKDTEVGMIGVSGGKAQIDIPSSWWHHNLFAKSAINLVMSSDERGGESGLYHYLNKSVSGDKEDVVIIDGLWFCIRKSLFGTIRFDERSFKGFHLYDADISMQIGALAKRYVVYDIVMKHSYSGTVSSDYYTDMLNFIDKWEYSLPQQSADLTADYSAQVSGYMLRSFILELVANSFPASFIRDVQQKYLEKLKNRNNRLWHLIYFWFASVLGYKKSNSLFCRIEKLRKITSAPGFSKTAYHMKNGQG